MRSTQASNIDTAIKLMVVILFYAKYLTTAASVCPPSAPIRRGTPSSQPCKPTAFMLAKAAKLAGHKSPAVTLGFYAHLVSDADAAVAVLDRAFVTEAVTERLAGTRSGCFGAPNEG